jgi:hypothetical protein
MLSKLYPAECALSAYDIDYDSLYRQGYRGIIYDIDNTLVPDNAPADDKSRELIRRLKDMGFSCLVLSNNDLDRVKSFADDVGAMYIYKAAKPSRSGYIEAMQMLGTDRSTTVFIGDQLFTDICGANRSGLRNILVRPVDKRERLHIIFKRVLEKAVMFFYRISLKKGAV